MSCSNRSVIQACMSNTKVKSNLQVLICASVLAQNAAAVKQASLKLLAAVFTLHSGGFAFGYFLARLFGVKERQARTMSIEVGM